MDEHVQAVVDDTDVDWLTPGQQLEWKSLMGMMTSLQAALDLQLKRDAGMNMFDYHVLVALSASPDRTLQMSEIALLARGSLSRLSHAVARLENLGWVQRRASADGGRRIDAWLTDAGWAKLQATAPGHVAEARRLVVDALTPAQLAALGEASRAVVTAAGPDLARALDLDLRTSSPAPDLVTASHPCASPGDAC
ncbi:MarR family winged helix-turn-helix transcriptional regulator [Terracoccus luteus]|uniref:DNA-binding MarR family transcriptional regulator n=1 Tax=Terracoccus luteus TaxID=53356 RepID=A0A495XWB1_9MICO|nr:MarR family winged helix-turn-helix transcriptional regulator [Terracoccus luteus]MBB2987067.1 DNA-binding MarR family transcriptional regulator [Terracoccus luteus]MCP2172718.1 DNA-binding MarR family transcriptional regulator [Terracoccus luteus]RKT77114.1 DNA-binding MarR family transcriptional regulator [Terracoccus luteus]